MKLFLVALLGCLSSAIAAPTPNPSESPTLQFSVTNFYASHIPHSVTASCQMDVVSNIPFPDDFNQTSCYKNKPGTGFGGLATFGPSPCENKAVKFALTTNDQGNYTLHIRYQTGTYTGSKTFPAKAVKYNESPPGSGFEYAYLDVPTHFKVPIKA